jgi:hypothetical protein
VNLRGLITSLGAGGSLIAAALCAAVLAGGLLAFRGGVDEPAPGRAGDVTLPGATARNAPDLAASSAPAERRAAARRADPAARREAPAPRRVDRSRRTSPAPVSAPPVARPPAGGDESVSTGEDAGGGSGPAAPAPPPAEGEQAGTVRRTVQQTREAVAPVVEAVPEPVQPTVNEVADTVEQVAGTVDETVAGLLPR